MTAFDEVRFPPAISRGSSGGPERQTEIVALASGREERNTRHAMSRRRYNAGFGIATLDELHAVVAFFEERRGRLHGFRWKDHADFKSSDPSAIPAAGDQAIGSGDGTTAVFQLTKRYGTGLRDYERAIKKPVAGTVKLAVAGVDQIEGSDFSVDYATGLVTFAPGHIPPDEAAVTAGFEFDVPVRFDTDSLVINLAAFRAGEIPDIPIVEIVP
jgi:uncharacterized protein (TIGR02217 family)